MANKNLTDLTARTATADSDLIHVNSGGTDYKQVKSNFVSDLAQEVSFNNTSLITTQCDAIATEKGAGLYFGTVSGYGHQAETGLPVNDHFLIQLEVRSTATMRLTVKRASGLSTYENLKSTTWYGYTATPQRDEITSLNNSLANIGSRNVSHYAQHATSATMAYTGVSFTISKNSVVRADLYYTYNQPREIAITDASSGNMTVLAHGVYVDGVTNVMVSCTAALGAGTYYVWARSSSAGNNYVGLVGFQIAP